MADYEAIVDYAALSRLLVGLVQQDPPYVLVLDRTEWHFGQTPVNVLMIGIAHRGIAFPIAWTTTAEERGLRIGNRTRSWRSASLCALDASDVEALTADAEFMSVWLKRRQAPSIPFVDSSFAPIDGLYRRASRARFRPTCISSRMPHRDVPRPSVWSLEGTGGAHVPVQILVRRIGSDTALKDRFLVLATSGVDPERGPTLYRRRWEVETLFAALKSRGFDLEATHLTAPSRIRRLIGLLAIAFAWSHLVGEKRAETARPAPNESPRTPKPEPLPLRTGPAPGHPHHTGAAANGV